MTDQEKLLEKLGKIKKHAESAAEIGNEQEAQAFAAMLQTMLLRHKLEMSDIKYDEHLKDEPVEKSEVGGGPVPKNTGRGPSRERVYRDYPDVEIRSCRVDWIENLASVIAQAHSCQILISPGSSRIWMVGRKSDTQIAEYLFVTMLRTAEKLSHKEYKRFRAQCRARDNGGGRYLYETHGYKASWLDGFIMRLMQRFEEEKRKMEGANSGVGLMRINKEALAVREYLDNMKGGKKASALRGQSKMNYKGYEDGKKSANGLRLDANAVRGGGQANKQLD